MSGLKVWTGSAFAPKPLKWWNGSAWVQKPLKRWTGTAWANVSGPTAFVAVGNGTTYGALGAQPGDIAIGVHYPLNNPPITGGWPNSISLIPSGNAQAFWRVLTTANMTDIAPSYVIVYRGGSSIVRVSGDLDTSTPGFTKSPLHAGILAFATTVTNDSSETGCRLSGLTRRVSLQFGPQGSTYQDFNIYDRLYPGNPSYVDGTPFPGTLTSASNTDYFTICEFQF